MMPAAGPAAVDTGLGPTAARWGSPGATRDALLLLVAAWLVGAGCAAVRPQPLEVPPGHRAVLGRVDLSRFEVQEALIDIVRDDGSFSHALRVGPGGGEFAITLPPGRYRVVRLHVIHSRHSSPDLRTRELKLAFDVGPEPATYVGTAQLVSGFDASVRATVADEYEATLRVVRCWHPSLPEPIRRSLMAPA